MNIYKHYANNKIGEKMKKKVFIVLMISAFIFINVSYSQDFSGKKILLKTTNYELDIRVDFEKEKLFSICEMTFVNPTVERIQTIPLLLYRLMKVSSVTDENGDPLFFNQQVLSFDDWEVMQVNFIEVKLKKPILKNQSKKIIIKYSGFLLGYSETGMNYVQDKIDTEYTIIRPDCQAYPELGYPSSIVNKVAGMQSFDYTIHTTVPDSLFVVNGGKIVSKEIKNGLATYTYNNTKKAWRIDIAIGKYGVIEYDNAKLYFFKKDSTGAKTVLKYMKSTFKLYTKWWGPLQDFQGFSVIEVPDGFGSQADVTSILQTASVFKDSTQMRQMYHEISHIWNVESKDKFYSRWNEGLATFIEYLTIEKLENREYVDYVTDWYYKLVKRELSSDSIFVQTPMIDFGKKGIESYSYSMGMIMFQVLYKIVGEEKFNEIIGSFYQKYYKTGATTDEFIYNANQVTSIDLTDFFNDWIYTTNYTEYFQKDMSINKIVTVYKNK